MRGFVAFPTSIQPSHLLSATSQDGAKITKFVPAGTNSGSGTVNALGTLEATSNPMVNFTTGGALTDAKFRFSHDAGANWSGRWNGLFTDGDPDVNDEGSFGLAIMSVNPWEWDSVTQPVLADTNGDGIPDMVFCVIADSTNKKALLCQTPDLTGRTYWESRALFTNAGQNLIRVGSLLIRGGILYVTTFHDTGTLHTIELWRSADWGTTWASTPFASETGTIIPQDAVPKASLHTGADGHVGIGVVYPYYTSGKYHTAFQWTINGIDVSTRYFADPGNAHNQHHPTIFTRKDGWIIVIYKDQESNVAVSRVWDPTVPGFIAGPYTMTTFDSDPDLVQHNAVVAPDGTVYLFAVDIGGDDKIVYSKLKGDGTFPAPTDILSVTAKNFSYPMPGAVGGGIWLMTRNATDKYIQIQQTMYPVDLELDGDGYPTNPSWCGNEELGGSYCDISIDHSLQYWGNGLWLKFGGSAIALGDTWAADAVYTYGAHRMVMFRPQYPARSTADDVDWEARFDLSAYKPLPFNSVFVITNVTAILVQGDDTNTNWNSPEWSAAISTVRQTVASGGYVISGYKATRTDGGTFVPHALRGFYAAFGIGRSVQIIDNDETTIWCLTSIAGQSGTLKIITGRGWVKTSMVAKKYLRFVIAPEQTASGKYEINALVFAQWSALTAAQRVAIWEHRTPAEDYETPGGSLIRYPLTSMTRKAGVLSMLAPTLNQYQELSAQFSNLQGRPVAYVKDQDDDAWWDMMMPQAGITWNPRKTDIGMIEVI